MPLEKLTYVHTFMLASRLCTCAGEVDTLTHNCQLSKLSVSLAWRLVSVVHNIVSFVCVGCGVASCEKSCCNWSIARLPAWS